MKTLCATCGILAMSALMGGVSPCLAGTVTYVGPVSESGTGIGAVHTIVNVKTSNGRSTTEYGKVIWDGSGDVVTGSKVTGGANNQTYTVAQLNSFGIDQDTLGIVFNVNEPGNDKQVTLDQYSVLFFDSSGNELSQSDYTDPKHIFNIDDGGSGVGNDGFLFHVDDDAALTSFFADPTNRLGLKVSSDFPITDASAGYETFHLANPASFNAVPTPTAALAGLAMFGGMGLRKRRTNRLRA